MTMLGIKHSEATKEKIRAANKNNPKLREVHKGEKAYNYKGDNVSYAGLHAWVRRWRGTPSLCEHCKSTAMKRYEWANKSGKYKRDLEDWIRLCKSCHNKHDRTGYKGWKTRRANQTCV